MVQHEHIKPKFAPPYDGKASMTRGLFVDLI